MEERRVSGQGNEDRLAPLLGGLKGFPCEFRTDLGSFDRQSRKEDLCRYDDQDVAAAPEMIYGVLSLMPWGLVVIVTIEYVLVMLQADNDGEGGTLSLMALA